jgi:hypothetical protein
MGTATAGSALTKQIGGAFGLACAQTLIGHSPTAPTAPAIGSTIGWSGTVAGLLAVAALLLTRDISVPSPGISAVGIQPTYAQNPH